MKKQTNKLFLKDVYLHNSILHNIHLLYGIKAMYLNAYWSENGSLHVTLFSSFIRRNQNVYLTLPQVELSSLHMIALAVAQSSQFPQHKQWAVHGSPGARNSNIPMI